MPDEQVHFIDLNADLSKKWRPIIEKKDPLPDADDWASVKDKLDHLKR